MYTTTHLKRPRIKPILWTEIYYKLRDTAAPHVNAYQDLIYKIIAALPGNQLHLDEANSL